MATSIALLAVKSNCEWKKAKFFGKNAHTNMEVDGTFISLVNSCKPSKEKENFHFISSCSTFVKVCECGMSYNNGRSSLPLGSILPVLFSTI